MNKYALKTKITGILTHSFPAMRTASLDHLADLIIGVSRDDQEALSIASNIPRRRFGTFRLDAQTREWIVIYPDFQPGGYCR